jgi:hypothetical protein
MHQRTPHKNGDTRDPRLRRMHAHEWSTRGIPVEYPLNISSVAQPVIGSPACVASPTNTPAAQNRNHLPMQICPAASLWCSAVQKSSSPALCDGGSCRARATNDSSMSRTMSFRCHIERIHTPPTESGKASVFGLAILAFFAQQRYVEIDPHD